MKKNIYALILPLVVVSGLVFANHENKNDDPKKPSQKSLTATEKSAGRRKWEASPDGIAFNKWKASPEGQKVYAGAAKIKKHIAAFTKMEAVVTSTSLPPGSRLGFGVMVRIKDDDYILTFDVENHQPDHLLLKFDAENHLLDNLHSLKVNDELTIKSRSVSYAPKYSYPIVSADYVERDNKLIYKRIPRKGGC
ncbi:hypothetical protein DJ568_05530 [Mucilaginibacter hurinus]|uniref:Uncharacterized protein n=1 Tax=Mucilaginibacter hurinus TaxID=2201324 RepID=A0A367GSQ7_9SPHI|nr:hypothetical protein [Mucilaginibacter hurinus]RCH56198.1 hypothetical protein DJ568_05530 [Mucilaginibacter hurinus]